MGFSFGIVRPVLADEFAPLVVVEALLDPVAPFLGAQHGGLDRPGGLGPREVGQVQQRVEAPEHLDVRVEVDAPVVVKGVEADVVGGKGVFFGLESLFHPRYGLQIETFRVPEHDLVVGQELFPACETLLDLGRVGVSAQPAEVDLLGDHGIRVFISVITFCICRSHESRPSIVVRMCSGVRSAASSQLTRAAMSSGVSSAGAFRT